MLRKESITAIKYFVLIVAAVLSIFPLYFMFVTAISGWGPITWLPLNPRWENFVHAWGYMQYPPLWRALLNSVLVSVSRTMLVLFVSSLTAYALATYEFRGSRAIFLWILAQIIIQGGISLIPGVVNVLPLYLLMTWLGWFNTYWSLIIPGAFSAFSIFLLRQYFITIPREILDAARLSGCSEIGIFWRMVLPLSKPALAAVGLINFVFVWNELLWPSLMIKDPSWFPVQVALSWASPSGPLGAALITLAILPLIAITIIFQKYLLKGFAGFGYTNR